MFFYPKANTPGCTVQGCSFRDSYEEFVEKGFKIFGCSADNAKPQTTFKTKQKFQYDLLSDKDFKLISAIGSKTSDGRITRSHVVVAKGGKVLEIAKSSPKESVPMALEAIANQ